MRLVLGVLLLSGLWMLLFGQFDGLTFVVGLIVGVAAIRLSRSVFGSDASEPNADATTRPSVGIVQRLWSLVKLAWYYTYEIIACNLMMARDVLSPAPQLTPAIFALEVPGLGPAGSTLLANLITLTPGSLVIDFDPVGETLYIHTIYAQDVETMKRDYRRFARQVFRLTGREPSQALREAG
ncbi:Na+/H+ antiporter subunit E [Tautonia marina]|uniref:Na+/H+ antiporter subunit E n=1 Tax=Tautonia marina TaxID=2653855 RepID=UPI0012608188|nr:Na+/H+ antiporter subunit E [Tautonia marina]